MIPDLPSLNGFWSRTLLRTPDWEDRSTKVIWAQGPELFADLRIPAAIDALEPQSQHPVSGHAHVFQCEGFAGTTDVTDGICHWHREINLQGPEQGADIGALRWEVPQQILIEDGVHATYSETWERLPGGPAESFFYAEGAHRLGYLIASDTHFLFAFGDPRAKEDSKLREEYAADPESYPFTQVMAYGRWVQDAGRIISSTLPALKGQTLFHRGTLESGGLNIALPELSGGCQFFALSLLSRQSPR